MILSNQGTWREGIEVVRFNADGSVDQTFGSGGQTIISQDPFTDPEDAFLQTDGKLVVVGRSGLKEGAYAPGNFAGAIFTARLDANGALDPAWGIGGKSKIAAGDSAEARAATQESGGQIVLVGNVRPINANPESHSFLVARLDGDSNQAFVQHVFVDLLSRPVDASALGYFTTHLDDGTLSRNQVVRILQASTEYRQNIIRETYQQFLARDVDPVGLSSWTSFLASGGTKEELQAKILASGEFYERICGGKPDVFLNSLYLDVLHRPVDPGGQAAFDRELFSGKGRASVVAAVLGSSEHYQDEIESLYLQFLARQPDSGGLEFFQSQLESGAPVDPIISRLAASEEYFAGL